MRYYKDDQTEAKIIHKVEDAINEMVNKTLRAYSKIKGSAWEVKENIFGKEKCLRVWAIRYHNKIFQEVLNEASEFKNFKK